MPPALGKLDFILKDLQTNEFLRESARASELVQSHIREVHTGPDRGVKQAGFAVLASARRPAILIELGYSTNPEDGRLMSSPNGQAALADRIADAIVAYLREYDRRTGDAQRGIGKVMRRLVVGVVLLSGCTWSNSLYQARRLAAEGEAAARSG